MFLNKISQNNDEYYDYIICVSVGYNFGMFWFFSWVITITLNQWKKFNSSSVYV